MRTWVGLFLAVLSVPTLAQTPFANKLAPYVASPGEVVDRMLEMARIKPGETVYDLGSGDGRILIAAVERYKAKAVGVEISPALVRAANAEIEKAGLTGRARVIEGDALEVDFSEADVVTLYLETEANAKLRPRLERFLKPGARVVSHDYEVPGWKPTRVEQAGDNGQHEIYLYELPARQ